MFNHELTLGNSPWCIRSLSINYIKSWNTFIK